MVEGMGHKMEATMGDIGKKDKGKREQRKKAQHSLKEKRRLKKEKGQINTITLTQ
jgi:hypothetical protein